MSAVLCGEIGVKSKKRPSHTAKTHRYNQSNFARKTDGKASKPHYLMNIIVHV